MTRCHTLIASVFLFLVATVTTAFAPLHRLSRVQQAAAVLLQSTSQVREAVKEKEETSTAFKNEKGGTLELLAKEQELIQSMEDQADSIVEGMLDEECSIDDIDICSDEEKKAGFRATLKRYIKGIESLVVGRDDGVVSDDDTKLPKRGRKPQTLTGDALEKGCT